MLQNEDSPEKVTDIINHLVLQIVNTCDCDFSNGYVADPSLTCETRDDEVAIFQAKIISTAENTSTEFLQLLQDWAKSEPLVVVNHVQLRLVMECSVQLNDIGETECIPIDGTPISTTSSTNGTGTTTPSPTTSTNGTDTAANTAAVTTTTQPPVVIIIISTVIVCGTLLLTVIIISICCCYFVKRSTKANIRRDDFP